MSDSKSRNLPRIYITEALIVGQTLTLNTDLLHYLRDVLRLKIGEWCYVFNGEGGEYLSRIVSFSKKQGEITIEQWIDVERESSLQVTLVQGIARGEKMDWIIQKAVELGVTAVQPVITEYSNVRLSEERWQHKQEHWQGVAAHAAAQSGRTRVPQVQLPAALLTVMSHVNNQYFDCSCVLSPHDGSSAFLQNQTTSPETIAIYVGPEGGFSPAEMALFQRHGIPSWCLGQRILRTETAPLVALSLLQFIYGDLRVIP